MQIEIQSSSERLQKMLKNTLFGIKHGQIELISKATGYTRTAVSRWLSDDSLPRNPEERLLIAQKLNVDLIYWEYGTSIPALKNGNITDASIYRAIFQVIDDKNCHDKISQSDMDAIKSIINCANNQTFFQDLITLVEHLIEMVITKTEES